jgi:hypothetical protein
MFISPDSNLARSTAHHIPAVDDRTSKAKSLRLNRSLPGEHKNHCMSEPVGSIDVCACDSPSASSADVIAVWCSRRRPRYPARGVSSTGFSRAVISPRSDYPFLASAVSQTRDVPIDIQHPPAGGDSSRRGQLCISFAGAPRSAPLGRDHAAAPSQEGFSSEASA